MIEKKVAIIGLGYVGLPLAVEFGKVRATIGFDIEESRVCELKKGYDSTLEVSKDQIDQAINLEITSNNKKLKECSIFIVTVPTPIDEVNRPDLKFIIKASEIVAENLKNGDIVIYESTVFPGCTEEICVPVLEKISGLKFNEDFELILRIAKSWMFFGVNRVGFIQHIREDSWSKSDPYVSYAGVEDFLETALNEELLPLIEIKIRRKENRLSLVKRILIQRTKWDAATPFIDEAFDIIRPQNIKEFTLFILNKILKKL